VTGLERLEAAAAAWEGTPFCERSAVRGAGVSCSMLCFSVYHDAGWLPDLVVPNAPVGWSRSQNRSIMEEYLDHGEGLEWFARVAAVDAMQPGDLLGFRLGHCIHHLAILLGGGRVVSSVEQLGVRISPCLQPVWFKRLAAVWRPTHPST